MKGKALRKHNLHEKTAASVLLKLFIKRIDTQNSTAIVSRISKDIYIDGWIFLQIDPSLNCSSVLEHFYTVIWFHL